MSNERPPLSYYYHRGALYGCFLFVLDAVGAHGQYAISPTMELIGLDGYEYVFKGDELGERISFGPEMPDPEAVGQKYGSGIIEKRAAAPSWLSIPLLFVAYYYRGRASKILAAHRAKQAQ